MKYKVRLTAPEIREFTLNKNYMFNYSDRMVYWFPTRHVEVFASIKDAETLQRLNPQHEVEIYSVNDKCYFPLWFFRTYIGAINHGGLRVRDMYDYLLRGNHTKPYEPVHPIVDQAPAFIYRTSERFKQKLHERQEDKWFGKGWRQKVTEPLTVSKLQEYLTDIFIARNRSGKETRQIKVGIYCPHRGHWVILSNGPDGCPRCYADRLGPYLKEYADSLKQQMNGKHA